ncbi:MAG TPA: hypothetical protein VK588_09720 [Chitinophagaceae bacterium]|nr:hypothetical protein [Chitinophagaceae bacterium]
MKHYSIASKSGYPTFYYRQVSNQNTPVITFNSHEAMRFVNEAEANLFLQKKLPADFVENYQVVENTVNP